LEGDKEIDVMLRILRMSTGEILQTRLRLRKLSEELNKQTLVILEAHLDKACQIAR
jgi:hypothetical protein